nr:Clp protease N-terminal domain-containing protein [Thermogemmatispora onikobensis]
MRAALEAASQRGHAVLTPFHLLLGFCASKTWDLYLFPAGPSSALIAPTVESLLEQESSALQLQWQLDPALQEALASAREEAHERGYPIGGIETFLVPDAALQRIFALAKDEARQHSAQHISLGPLLLGLLRVADEGLLPPSLQQLLTRFGLSYAVVRSSLSEETFSL